MFVIDYNPREAAMLREKVLEFDAMLRAGIQPPANHDRDCDRLAVRYGNTAIVDDPGVEIPDELAELYLGPYVETGRHRGPRKSGHPASSSTWGSRRRPPTAGPPSRPASPAAATSRPPSAPPTASQRRPQTS
ncbi:hypothetical protein GS532_22605 [Rhodococcus hoagii]|nr:hypothetical protein [Prescottella equi]